MNPFDDDGGPGLGEPEQMLTTKQAAERLGIKTQHILRLFSLGLLPEPIRFGRNRVIPESTLPAIQAAFVSRGWSATQSTQSHVRQDKTAASIRTAAVWKYLNDHPNVRSEHAARDLRDQGVKVTASYIHKVIEQRMSRSPQSLRSEATAHSVAGETKCHSENCQPSPAIEAIMHAIASARDSLAEIEEMLADLTTASKPRIQFKFVNTGGSKPFERHKIHEACRAVMESSPLPEWHFSELLREISAGGYEPLEGTSEEQAASSVRTALLKMPHVFERVGHRTGVFRLRSDRPVIDPTLQPE